MSKLNKIFDSFIDNKIFENKSVLQSNYTPDNIPHRDEQIEQVASILAPTLRSERTSNLFVYGKPGSGKTLSVQYVTNEITDRSKKLGVNLRIDYINCKMRKVADTEYRILAELVKKLGGNVPATGLPTEQIYNKFIELIEREPQLVVLILDEIDQAVKKISDNFLYNLTRLNSELARSQISIIGISNDLTFVDNLDPRVRSSLSEEEIIFPPYNALQLQDILNKRAVIAFKKSVLEDGVIAKCAAYAAREHGDARRALDLLRIAGEIAERESSYKIKLEHIDKSNEKIESEKILDIVATEPKQFQLTLLAIIILIESKSLEKIFTGDIYNIYQEVCRKTKNETLTQRRVSDIIAEFDMLGLLNARVISKGRYGRTREIKLNIPIQIIPRVKDILNNSLHLS
ncbi:ORC1-type DNA replication protein [Candidatus Pacearchaeota archaeon]|nr:ORC1-type DNA replication protein [Candidatus Pacearchaeota archaeon]